MGSLAEDEAAKRHSYAPPSRPPSFTHPPPPPAPAHLWHAAAPFASPLHRIPHWRAQETVINGTTWYYQAPSLHPGSSDSHFFTSAFSRYGSPSPSHSVNFDTACRSHPSPHRHPHNFPPTGSPSAYRGFPPPSGAPSGFTSADGPHGSVARGYPFVGADSGYGIEPGYKYNEQHAYVHHYGYAEPHMSSQANVYGGMMASHVGSHDGLSNSARRHGSMGRARTSCGGYTARSGSNASYGMPPHAVKPSGKTFRQAVTWCGMTMPVTITSQAAAVIDWIQRQRGDLFGFDLEWKPNRLKGEDNLVATLQICGPADCLIVQLLYTDMIPKLLKEFLSNSRKCLGGVGIRQDVKKLERDHDLVCQGQVELGTLASEKLRREELQGIGLKKLVDKVLGMTLVKIKKITMSNWEKEYLDEKQIEYACIDAWAAFAILQKLMTL